MVSERGDPGTVVLSHSAEDLVLSGKTSSPELRPFVEGSKDGSEILPSIGIFT